jgi:hypothetical protein
MRLAGRFYGPRLPDRTVMNLNYAPLTAAEKYRAECISWIARFEPSLFVTFVFNAQVTPAEAQRKLEAFHMRVDRRLVGRAVLRKPEKRSSYIATIEKPEANIHIHALFKLTDRQRVAFGLVAPAIWQGLVKGGNLDLQPVTYAEGAAAYITKALRPETSERLLMPPHLEKQPR